eukprot:3458259-Rhodomonas_salina.1
MLCGTVYYDLVQSHCTSVLEGSVLQPGTTVLHISTRAPAMQCTTTSYHYTAQVLKCPRRILQPYCTSVPECLWPQA